MHEKYKRIIIIGKEEIEILKKIKFSTGFPYWKFINDAFEYYKNSKQKKYKERPKKTIRTSIRIKKKDFNLMKEVKRLYNILYCEFIKDAFNSFYNSDEFKKKYGNIIKIKEARKMR